MIRNEKRAELQLIDILQLNDELGELSKIKMSIVFKAHLSKLKRKTEKFAKDFKELDSELIRKYGVVEGDNYIVKKEMESWSDYVNDRKELLTDKHEILFGEIIADDFEGVESELDFPILFGLIEN